VSLSQREAALDRDFVLSVTAAGLDAPRGWIEREDDGTEAVAVAFAPAFRDASAPAEIESALSMSHDAIGQCGRTQASNTCAFQAAKARQPVRICCGSKSPIA
jgi:hypothetical protein